MRSVSLPLAARARGTLLGALAGGGEAALLEILADELAAGRTDLRRLAERWVARHRSGPVGEDPETVAALEFLAAHGAPPAEGRPGDGALARAVPVAIVARRSPRTLVSATYHIAALTHPAPESAWAAVAVTVALARLLEGRRDFVPDVLEALTGNGAPEPLLSAVRRVPLMRRDALPPAAPAMDAVHGAALALALAHHEPLTRRALDHALAPGRSATAAAAGALLGARDGDGGLPAELLPPDAAGRWAGLAERLVQLAAGAATAPA